MIKHRNVYWLGFLIFVALSVLAYTVWTISYLYQYSRLTHLVPVQTIEWSLLPISEDDIALQAHYTFLFNNKSHQGRMVWPEHYLNEWAAQEALTRFKAQAWKAWVNPKNLYYSTLQKKFPIKQCISTIVLWGLLLYFIGLDHYVNRYIASQKP